MDGGPMPTAKQKKLASARKKLKQFQQRKTPQKMEDDMEAVTPHIDDMSTWPNYSFHMQDSPTKVDYSLNGPSSDPESPGLNGGGQYVEDPGHNGHHEDVNYASVDLEGLDSDPVPMVDSVSSNSDGIRHGYGYESPVVENSNNHVSYHGDQEPVSPHKLDGSSDSYVVPETPFEAQRNSVNSAHTPTSPPTFHPEKTTASTEGLQQLSRKINGLISESKDYLNGDYSNSEDSLHDLESRNRELASSVEKLHQENEQLRIGNNELKQHNNLLTSQLQQERTVSEERLRKEMAAVKEQLQIHIQTIGILVAEKSELQSNVAQFQKDSEKKKQEIEELSGRLKASRTKVNDLEREIAASTTNSQHFEKSNTDLAKDVDRLRMESYNATKALEDARRRNSELSEKLQAKNMECEGFEQSVGSLKHMVEMKDVLIQQLSSQPTDVHAQALDMMQQERVELINRLEQYNEAFHQLTAERDHITDQYQTYIDQLTVQVAQGRNQISQLTEDKEKLSLSLNEAQDENETLTEKLRIATTQPTEESPQDTARVQDLQTRLENLTADYHKVSLAYEEQQRNNGQLSKFVEERTEKINQLELEIHTLREEAVDKGQLLESIQNDKSALSRALAQNKELRTQLEELQTAFVKVQNENMELTTGFQTVEYQSKQFSSRLQFLETELDDKIEEIGDLHEKLEEASSTIENLSLSLPSYKDEQHSVTESRASHSSETTGPETTEEAGEARDETEDDFVEKTGEHMHDDKDILALEKKYAKLTRENAELLDRNERLEHVITQLEGETDTIGEYITRYHHERALLGEREHQKELHLTTLAREREELKLKLSELQNLIAQLILERDRVSESGTVLERRRRGEKVKKVKSDDDWPSDTDSSDESAVEVLEVSRTGVENLTLPKDQVTERIMNLIQEMESEWDPSAIDAMVDAYNEEHRHQQPGGLVDLDDDSSSLRSAFRKF